MVFHRRFISGQKERFRNVFDVLKSAVTGRGVTADIRQPTLKRAVEFAASNPFLTAGFVAGGLSAPIRGAAKKGVVALGKVVGRKVAAKPLRFAVGGLVGAGALVSSPTLRKKLVGAPKTLFEGGKTIGSGIEQIAAGDPEGGLTTLQKGLLGAGVVGAVVAGGIGVAKLIKGRKAAAVGGGLTGLLPGVPFSQPPIVGEIPTITEQPTPEENGKLLKQVMPEIKLTSNPKINIVVQNALS